MMVYICTKFHENILDGYRANTIYIAKISKGHNSVENVVGVTVLFFSLQIVSWWFIFLQSFIKIF